MKKINKLMVQIRRLGREDQGLTMVEYAVAGALIAVAATVAFQSLGSAVASKDYVNHLNDWRLIVLT